MIITGAPIENMPLKRRIIGRNYAKLWSGAATTFYSVMHICWGAQAGLYYHFNIPKYVLPQKLSGIFTHRVLDEFHPLVRGFDDVFCSPHSRNTEVHREDIDQHPELAILTDSDLAGVHIIANKNGRQFFITGHLEYDRNTPCQ